MTRVSHLDKLVFLLSCQAVQSSADCFSSSAIVRSDSIPNSFVMFASPVRDLFAFLAFGFLDEGSMSWVSHLDKLVQFDPLWLNVDSATQGCKIHALL